MAADLSAADFSPLTGQILVARVTGVDMPVEVPLTLTAVDEGTAHAEGFRDPFTLALSGPPAPVLAQGIYEIIHPTRGELAVFVVPHAATAAGAEYTVTFS